jgi:hypothetical protein
MNEIIKLITDGEYTAAQIAEGLFAVDAADDLYEASKPKTFADAAAKFKINADKAMGSFGAGHAQALSTGAKSPIRTHPDYWGHIARLHKLANENPGVIEKFAKHPIMQAHEHVLATTGKSNNPNTGSFIARKDHPVSVLGKKAVANATNVSSLNPVEHYNKWAKGMHGAFPPIETATSGKSPVQGTASAHNPAAGGGASGSPAAGSSAPAGAVKVNPVSQQAKALAAETDPYYHHEELNPKTKEGHRLSDVANDPNHPDMSNALSLIGVRNAILKDGIPPGGNSTVSDLDLKYGKNGPHAGIIAAARKEFETNGPSNKFAGSSVAYPKGGEELDPETVARMAKKKAERAAAPVSPPSDAPVIKDPYAGHKKLDPVLPNGQRLSELVNTHPKPLVRTRLHDLIDTRDKILRGEVSTLSPQFMDTMNMVHKPEMGPTGASDLLNAALARAKNGDPESEARKQAIAKLAPKDAGKGLPAIKLGTKPLTPAATAAADPYKGHATMDPVGVSGQRVSDLLTSHPSRIVREKLRDLVTKRNEALQGKQPSKAEIQDLDTHLSKHLGKDAVQTLFANAAKEHANPHSSTDTAAERWDRVMNAAKASYAPKFTLDPKKQNGAPSTFGASGKLAYANPIARARILLGHKLRKWLHKNYPKDKLGTP